MFGKSDWQETSLLVAADMLRQASRPEEKAVLMEKLLNVAHSLASQSMADVEGEVVSDGQVTDETMAKEALESINFQLTAVRTHWDEGSEQQRREWLNDLLEAVQGLRDNLA